MFAVVRTGGKQYRVHPGDKIVVEKLDGAAGDRVTLGDVLLAGNGGDLKSTDGLTVAAEIVAQAKGEKVTVFKKRRRHNYRRKKGHRQQHTILKIVAIGDHKEPKKVTPTTDAAPKSDAAPAKAGKGNRPPRQPRSTRSRPRIPRRATRPRPTLRRKAPTRRQRPQRSRRTSRRPKPRRQKMLHLLRLRPRKTPKAK